MPLTDAYEFFKSNQPMDIMKNQPYSNYQYNYINDLNGGVFNNSTQSLIQYDLSSLYNSSTFTDTRSHFIVLPIVRCAEAFNNVGAQVALTDTSYYLTSLKNLQPLIHQVDLILGGRTVHQLVPYQNIYTNFKLLSELSKDDLKLMGPSLNIMDVDNPYSMTYNTAGADNISTPGIANNYVSGTPYVDIPGISTAQGAGVANGSIQQKLLLNKCKVSTYNGLSNVVSGVGMENEFQQSFEIINGVASWKDYVLINVKDLLNAMDNIGLTRRLDGILRLYVNTGFCKVTYPAPSRMLFANADSTFTDSCPFLINNNKLLPGALVQSLNVGLFISRPPSYTFSGSNWGNIGGLASPMNASRYYFNQVSIQPSLALDYISSNSAKTILYDSVLYNTFLGIPAGGNFSQLIQSGVTNIKTILIIPLVAQSTANIGFPAYKSPFDPVGGSGGHPISLQNLQVQVGGTNQLATSLNFTYEHFLQQLAKWNKQSSSEYGVESGLMGRDYWNNNRVYLVNVRSTEDDLNTPRNVVISFRNNSAVATDILVFVEYDDKFLINVSTGIITK